MQGSSFLDHPTPLAIAHRGGTEAAPENSLAAFAAAAAVGFEYLETDVHVTADGVIVAFHDDELDRVTDGTGRIAELDWDTVARARIDGVEPIPTLSELLETFPHQRFNIDSKSDDVVVPLVALLQRHDALDRVCLAAFTDDRAARLRALAGPDVCTTASPKEVAKLVAASKVGMGTRVSQPYNCLQVPVEHRGVEIVTPAFIDAAHHEGSQVHVWTIDDPAEMARLLDLGVDGLFTDLPSVLQSVLVDRGEWAPQTPK